MTDKERMAAQEQTILRQRVTIAEQGARITKLQAMHEANQRMIDKLQGRIRRLEKDPAVQLFKNGGE